MNQAWQQALFFLAYLVRMNIAAIERRHAWNRCRSTPETRWHYFVASYTNREARLLLTARACQTLDGAMQVCMLVVGVVRIRHVLTLCIRCAYAPCTWCVRAPCIRCVHAPCMGASARLVCGAPTRPVRGASARLVCGAPTRPVFGVCARL